MILLKQPKISKQHLAVLMAMSQLGWVTAKQMQFWLNLKALSSVYRALNVLSENQLLESLEKLNPKVFRLSTKGARIAGIPYRKRTQSFSVISNQVHRNEAIIALSASWAKVELLPKIELYKRGLNPAHSEWAVEYDSGIIKEGAFLLVDDYAMPSSRPLHCWTRYHRPNNLYYSVSNGGLQYWSSIFSHLIIATTGSPERFKRHLDKYAIEKTGKAVPYEILKIEHIWDGVTC